MKHGMPKNPTLPTCIVRTIISHSLWWEGLVGVWLTTHGGTVGCFTCVITPGWLIARRFKATTNHRKSQEASDCWSLCRLNPIPSPNMRPSSPNHKQDSCLSTGAIIYPSSVRQHQQEQREMRDCRCIWFLSRGSGCTVGDKMLRSLAAANQAALWSAINIIRLLVNSIHLRRKARHG